ncbi:hypothetical protein AMS68_004358 [Peltaster fructicola]|uniref:Inheritance of peroxisomes protein 1 n=1 Tax=Peltaster fructicola TaxID=286661 RepID=A0A6H0XW01_9PEZI|nr:hypothetical protein AMS68_004358 [Peltaster fructicola]
MASSTAPSTPEQKVRMLMNRSFTLPPKLDAQHSTPPTVDIGTADSVDTLFVHPHTSIIKFITNSVTSPPGSSSGARGLPWTSPTETTIAAGWLEIYRVPGSVSFLRSGTLLQAIMPRSQCWCVDGVSKFAMRVMPDTYYRIELPGETDEELALVEQFKSVLGKVMHYEKTTCPFARNSSEELPELEDIRNRRLRPEDNAKWLLDRSRLRKTGTQGKVTSPQRRVDTLRKEEGSPSRAVSPELQELVSKARAAPRSVTAPPKLLAKPLDQSMRSPFEDDIAATNLKSFQSIPTDMPPSPPDSSAGLDGREVELEDVLAAEVAALHMNEALLEVDTSTQLGELAEDDVDSSVLVHPRTESDDAADVPSPIAAVQPQVPAQDTTQATPPPLTRQISNPEDPFAAIQARILARRSIGGTTSFYPSTVRESTSCSTSSVSSTSTASTRSHASQLAQQKNLATELVRKACTAFIGPPAHLVALMLRIAARFANGTFGSMFFVESPSGASRRIPGSFEVNDDSFDEGISDDEDDFGVPLHSPIRLAAFKSLREREVKDGWEID